MAERIAKRTSGMSCYLKGQLIRKYINVLVTVEEFDDGGLIISAKYGDEEIGSLTTTVKE